MQDQAICPSAQPEQPKAVIIGVVRGSNGAVATGILPETVPLHPLIDLVPENVRPAHGAEIRSTVRRGEMPALQRRHLHARSSHHRSIASSQ